jgi:hypothetical protein
VPAESKGQKVKSFSTRIPLPDLSGNEKVTVPIYFQAKNSSFRADLPQHIAEGVHTHPDRPKQMRNGQIASELADEIQPAFEAACKLFERIQQNAVKKKVIQIFVQANGRNTQSFKSISFVSGVGPALSFSYRILWEINGGLYSQGSSRRDDNDTPFMTYITAAPPPEAEMSPYQRANRESFVIDWTEEREAFVENIRQGLETLIQRLGEVLIGDTTKNVDRLIAGGGLMLPAPQKEDA